MGAAPTRYRSADEDSSRWDGFPFRDGDIIISTRSKSGTTWMQMICALLVLRTTDLPQPLATMSPWLDWQAIPIEDVLATLEAQTHRRIVKTHTPLDGLPLDARATFIVVARHPLDMAVSLYHQGDNLDRERMGKLTGGNAAAGETPRLGVAEWLRSWIEWDGPPSERLDSLPGVMWHLVDAWSRSSNANIVLVHYDDLAADLEGEMRKLAERLGIDTSSAEVTRLATAATFAAMRANSKALAPDPSGVLEDRSAFFRRGRSGEASEILSASDMTRYQQRAAALAPPDLLEWLHRSAMSSRARGPAVAGWAPWFESEDPVVS